MKWDSEAACEKGVAQICLILQGGCTNGFTTYTSAGPIIAGVAGGLVLILVIIAIVVYCRKRKAAAAGNAPVPRRRGNGNSNGNSNGHKKEEAAAAEQPAAVTVSNQSFVGVQFNGAHGGGKAENDDTDNDDADGDDGDYIMRLQEAESITQRYQGKLRVPLDFLPPQDCRMSLLLAGDSLGVPDLAGMVEDVALRLEEDGIPPTHPEYNSRFALYTYTFNANHLPPAKQFYAVLNAGLRSRQEGWFTLWMPFIYYLTRALRELPDVVTTVYKGMAMPANVDKYNGKKKILWSGFSSTTTSEAVAQKFAGIGGLVLKIKVGNGKDVQPHSWFGTSEAELVLSPNMEFFVEGYPTATKKPYAYAGRTYIDLVQLPTETLYS